MKNKLFLVSFATLLTGCTFFTQPVYDDPISEQIECYKSTLCRLFINDLPPWTVSYTFKLHSNYKSHALDIFDRANSEGRPVTFVYGTIRGGSPYAVAVVGSNDEQYAFDSGTINDAPIPLKDLKHFMTVQGQTTDPEFLR